MHAVDGADFVGSRVGCCAQGGAEAARWAGNDLKDERRHATTSNVMARHVVTPVPPMPSGTFTKDMLGVIRAIVSAGWKTARALRMTPAHTGQNGAMTVRILQSGSGR